MRIINAVYYLKEGFKSAFKGFMGIASIAILLSCLVILGMFTLMTQNIELNLKNIEDQDEIVAFIDETLTIEQAQQVQPVIEAVSGIKETIFVSNTEALQTFEQDFDDAQDIMAALEDDNPLRHSYRIFVDDITKSDDIAAEVAGVPGVIKVRHNEYVTNNIISLRNVFSIISIVFFIILFALSIFIVYNTIRLATVARRKEINIMKFVGATNWFIRWPFIIEGIIIGLIAATLSFIGTWYIYTYFVDNVFAGINIVKLLEFSQIRGVIAALYYFIGLLIGVAGSTLAIRKYLKV